MEGTAFDLRMKELFAESIFDSFSKEEIEKFFGITVKKAYYSDNSAKEELYYNIYKGDEIIFGKLIPHEIEEIMTSVSRKCAKLLSKEAEDDTNPELGMEKDAELNKKRIEYQKKYYRTCPRCGIVYDSKHEEHLH